MAEEVLLLKMAGEIQLKSHFVRTEFVKTLLQNLKKAFAQKKLPCKKIEKKPGKLVIHSPEPRKLVPVIKKVFGVHSIALAEQTTALSLEEISSAAMNYSRKVLKKNDSFAVRANRLGKHSFSSQDIERACGTAIQKKFPAAKVNLSFPKKTIFVELDNSELLFYSEKIPGARGLPLGVEGTLPVLFEGKRLEEKSAWLLMKRGCIIKALILKESPRVKKALKNLAEWNSFSPIQSEKIPSLDQLEKRFKAVALTVPEATEESIALIRQLRNQSGLMVFNPLMFYPKELIKE